MQFTAISQPWLKDLAKRWTRWRLSCGLSPVACYHGVQAIARLAAFLAAARVTAARQISLGASPQGQRCTLSLALASAGAMTWSVPFVDSVADGTLAA